MAELVGSCPSTPSFNKTLAGIILLRQMSCAFMPCSLQLRMSIVVRWNLSFPGVHLTLAY